MPNYRIVVCGVMSGRSVDDVAESLAKMSLKPSATLRSLLDGRRVVIKRTFEVQKAAQYKRTLESIGCVCLIEADASAPPDPSVPAITVNFTTGTDNPTLPHNTVREYVYAKTPRLGIREIFRILRIKEWIAVAVLLLALYHGYKLFFAGG